MKDFCGRTRREFLWEAGAGFTGVALTALLDRDGFFGGSAFGGATAPKHSLDKPLSPLASPLLAKAKRCIFLFMYGGPSQMDLFDYKPELQKRHGQSVNMEVRRGLIAQQKLLGSKRKFARHGESGQWCSDALPCIARHMDKLAFIKSLQMDSFAHGSAMMQMNSGRILQGHPCLGSWVSYGLGTLNENLPGYVVMLDPRGGPIAGAANWSSGYMPAAYQGTVFRSTGQPILNLSPSTGVDRDCSGLKSTRSTPSMPSTWHPAPAIPSCRPGSPPTSWRFSCSRRHPTPSISREEAQATHEHVRPERSEPPHHLSLGSAPFGRQCLIARRLVERGVRFVQIYHGGGHNDQNWDAHSNVEKNLQIHCPEIDKPIAGLLTDLEQRGLLDETLVVWGGEFGRQAVAQGADGRDHNPKGFTYWLAGGGVKGGTSYGETDEIGHEAVVNRHHIRDLHATILHLDGLRPPEADVLLQRAESEAHRRDRV